MKIIIRTILLLLIFISNTVLAEIIEGKVVGIMDGDTIKILDHTNTQFKVRLSGIDSPEKAQPFYNNAKQSLSDLIFDKQVKIEYKKSDQYGRIVGKVIIDGNDANLEQVKRGYAWFFKQYQNELVMDDRLGYLHAHEAAQSSKQGLWIDLNPIPPWEFRKAKKAKRSFDTDPVADHQSITPKAESTLIIQKSPNVKNNNSDTKKVHCLNQDSGSEILACLND